MNLINSEKVRALLASIDLDKYRDDALDKFNKSLAIYIRLKLKTDIKEVNNAIKNINRVYKILKPLKDVSDNLSASGGDSNNDEPSTKKIKLATPITTSHSLASAASPSHSSSSSSSSSCSVAAPLSHSSSSLSTAASPPKDSLVLELETIIAKHKLEYAQGNDDHYLKTALTTLVNTFSTQANAQKEFELQRKVNELEKTVSDLKQEIAGSVLPKADLDLRYNFDADPIITGVSRSSISTTMQPTLQKPLITRPLPMSSSSSASAAAISSNMIATSQRDNITEQVITAAAAIVKSQEQRRPDGAMPAPTTSTTQYLMALTSNAVHSAPETKASGLPVPLHTHQPQPNAHRPALFPAPSLQISTEPFDPDSPSNILNLDF